MAIEITVKNNVRSVHIREYDSPLFVGGKGFWVLTEKCGGFISRTNFGSVEQALEFALLYVQEQQPVEPLQGINDAISAEG